MEQTQVDNEVGEESEERRVEAVKRETMVR